MKKKILNMLNEVWAAALAESVTKKFGEIEFKTTVDILGGGISKHTWKPQGIRLDRDIELFVEGANSGYVKAYEKITWMKEAGKDA